MEGVILIGEGKSLDDLKSHIVAKKAHTNLTYLLIRKDGVF